MEKLFPRFLSLRLYKESSFKVNVTLPSFLSTPLPSLSAPRNFFFIFPAFRFHFPCASCVTFHFYISHFLYHFLKKKPFGLFQISCLLFTILIVNYSMKKFNFGIFDFYSRKTKVRIHRKHLRFNFKIVAKKDNVQLAYFEPTKNVF